MHWGTMITGCGNKFNKAGGTYKRRLQNTQETVSMRQGTGWKKLIMKWKTLEWNGTVGTMRIKFGTWTTISAATHKAVSRHYPIRQVENKSP